MDKVKDTSYNENKNEARKISREAWTHWFHVPYELDWVRAHGAALERVWRYRSE